MKISEPLSSFAKAHIENDNVTSLRTPEQTLIPQQVQSPQTTPKKS